jgi:hypothetical protein
VKHIRISVEIHYEANFVFVPCNTNFNIITAFFIGLSGGSASAQEDSVTLAAATSEQTERNGTALQRIEDGSVISNEHTIKWRIFTDNAHNYFQKASNTLYLVRLR